MPSLSKLSVPKSYVDHMYNKVGELYQLNVDVDSLLKEAVSSIISINPLYNFSRLLYALYKLNSLINNMADIVKDFERYIITKKSYIYEEDFVIHGTLVWSRVLANMAMYRPPQQVIVVRSLNAPENIMLKLMLLNMKVRLVLFYKKLCEAIEGIKIKLSDEFGDKIDVIGLLKINPSYIKKKFLDKPITQIDNILKNTMLFHIVTPEKKIELMDLDNTSLDQLESINTRIEKILSSLVNIIQIDSMKKWKPKWVFKLIQLYNYIVNQLNDLKEVVAAIDHVKTMKNNEFCEQVEKYIKFISWKLYELYLLYLIIKALIKVLNVSTIRFDDRRIIIEYDDMKKLISIYWGKSLRSSIVNSMETLDGVTIDSNIIERLRGRPDLSIDIQGKVSIVLEAKFTRSIEYLTQSRFKAMAYMYEYRADIGILAYPGTPRKPRLVDEESYETLEILQKAEENEGVIIHLNNKSRLYIIPVIPLDNHFNSNVGRLEKPIKDALSSLLNKTNYAPSVNSI